MNAKTSLGWLLAEHRDAPENRRSEVLEWLVAERSDAPDNRHVLRSASVAAASAL